jgi:hypothetical protein
MWKLKLLWFFLGGMVSFVITCAFMFYSYDSQCNECQLNHYGEGKDAGNS